MFLLLLIRQCIEADLSKAITMSGFDDPGVFFSDNFGADDEQDENRANLQGVKKKFRDFLREFHEGNFNYKYR